jgi:4-phytase/acid phosphatase
VPPGFLTAHGRSLMKLLGAYNRGYFVSLGLMSASGCADAPRICFWADNEQRTVESAKALAEGMLPGCAVDVRSRPEGERDTLFAGTGNLDPNLASSAILGRIGSNPQGLVELYGAAFDELERVLFGCAPPKTCRPDNEESKRLSLRSSAKMIPGRSNDPSEVTGPFHTASTLTENLLLEYANGMTGKELGWGRLNEGGLTQIMILHTVYADLARRTPYIAQARGSNLLNHVLNSLRQAVAEKSVAGAIGKPGDVALVIMGHDTNISNLSGMLKISWLLPSYQPDDTPPGGSLVFELWRAAGGKQHSVRTYYTAQTLDQMRQAAPLTLGSPPAKAPVFIPGCSSSFENFDCDWVDFQRTAVTAIDPRFVER